MGMPACSVNGCEKTAQWGRKGWCGRHYQAWRRNGNPTTVIVNRQHAPSCKVSGCNAPYTALGFCKIHYVRFRRYGDPNTVFASHDGTGFINAGGYRVLYRPSHPMATKKGHVLEHRLIASERLGRPLFPDETVHHANGDKVDNRPENLEVWSGRHPKGARAEDQLAWAREVIERYAGTPYDPQVRSRQSSSGD